jgi:hypothetical protein
MSSSGRVSWPPEAPLWTFLWEVFDGDSEAIAFRDVRFRGKKVFHKASLPMIRVQYDSGHGPYKDPLSGGNMVGPVKVYEFTQSGFRCLVVESYHRIGRYHIVNRWLFWSDGLIQPQLHSAGLQHPSTHRHHVYWRFDFDIDGAANNLILEYTPPYTSPPPNWGYGPGWKPLTFEQATWDTSDNRWAVLRKGSNLGYVIDRGEFDGHADNFSNYDVWVVAYRGGEDLKGRLGTRYDDQIYQHVTGEDIDGKDVVLWYCAHLRHAVHDNRDEWHVCGPILWPFGY